MNKIVCRRLKIILFILCLFLNLNSYSAIVSDNDGSAFVTKAEFENLKENFAMQINNYNASIDNKIDGAISAYLAGVRLNNKYEVSLPYKDWEYVTSLNFALGNDYWYPNVSLTASMLGSMMYDVEISTNPRRFGYESWWCFANLKYERPSTKNSTRLLCDAGTEGTTYPDDIIYKGMAKDYLDNLTLARCFMCLDNNKLGYLWGSMENSMVLGYATRIKNGYFSNFKNENERVWEPKYWWNGSQEGNISTDTNDLGTGYRTISDTISKSNSSSIKLNIIGNKQTIYDHIINYNNVTYDYFSDVDWVNTLTYISDTSLTRETQLQLMTTRVGQYANNEFWNQNHLARVDAGSTTGSPTTPMNIELRRHEKTDLYDIVSGDVAAGRNIGYGVSGGRIRYENIGDKTDSTPIVSVGLIPKNYDSEHIKQTEKGFSQVVDNNQYDGQVLNLYNGFALLAAKTDDVIEWNPVFIDTYSNNVETDFEIKVQLALEPFGEGNTVSSNDKYIILDGDTTATPKETTDGKCKIKFTMPTNGIVYVKWWPASSTIEATDWRATLDLTQCGTYTREVS